MKAQTIDRIGHVLDQAGIFIIHLFLILAFIVGPFFVASWIYGAIEPWLPR